MKSGARGGNGMVHRMKEYTFFQYLSKYLSIFDKFYCEVAPPYRSLSGLTGIDCCLYLYEPGPEGPKFESRNRLKTAVFITGAH